MNSPRSTAHRAHYVRRIWWWLRQWSGDAAYENYLASFAAHREAHPDCPHQQPMSQKQFWLDSLERRYSGISRCC